jgi:hypothetical protein
MFMLAAAVPSPAIMAVLGPSGISVTMNTYAHARHSGYDSSDCMSAIALVPAL